MRHMCVEGSQYRPLPSGQTETAQEAVRGVKAHVLCQMVRACSKIPGFHPFNLHHDSRSDSDQMYSMMPKGCTLCLCVVAVLLAEAARSADLEEAEEVAMPLRTFLPRWYKHSCGLNRECLAVHQRQHNPEGAFYAQDEEDEAAGQKYFSGTHAGIFVELGATDGELFSNTKFFEDHRGWRVSLGSMSDVSVLQAVIFTTRCVQDGTRVCTNRMRVDSR